ncbi:MAG: hypothetical protein JSS61_02755 [Verrucomicrobia bacterium]|nr:hypothetical protein [Verrucomicrobiota bacterium]
MSFQKTPDFEGKIPYCQAIILRITFLERFLQHNSMQLIGYLDGKPFSALHADRNHEYICPECGSILRIRGGLHRQRHFYHLRPDRRCNQSKKSLEHLLIQLHLQKLFVSAEIERPFPEIGRIADVAYPEKNIVFEVQCSPLSREEAEGRCKDYASIGFRVIWLLYDRRFNQKKLSAAEAYLRENGCYFVSPGHAIYDQEEVIREGRRTYKGPPIPVIATDLPREIKRYNSISPTRKKKISLSRFLKKLFTRILQAGISQKRSR